MSTQGKEEWGFSSPPLHMELQQQQEQSKSDLSPPSDPEESLCCPSLSDLLTSCSNCCSSCFCCCRPSTKSDKFSRVSYALVKSDDMTDGAQFLGEKAPPYKPIFQFPQEQPQFPTHPRIPFKPNRIELRRPQMRYTPGGGSGRVVLPESPFPAPYLQDRGPGMQTPFSEAPIRVQPRGSLQMTAAMSAPPRKKRVSRTRVKISHDDPQSPLPIASTALMGDAEIGHMHLEESVLLAKRKQQGRHKSLPLTPLSKRGRQRIFSISTTSKLSEVEEALVAVSSSPSLLTEEMKHRQIHRARTVGSTPSQNSYNRDKFRRCQTPEFILGGAEGLHPMGLKGRRGLALRKCKTPDVLMAKQDELRETKRISDSPETETSSNLTPSSSPGSKSGQIEGEAAEEEESKTLQEDRKDSPASKIISTDGKKRWSRRDKSARKTSGTEGAKSSKAQTLPAHISAAPYLTRGMTITADDGASVASDEEASSLYFSLYFDIQRRALTVNLMKAENLPRKPSNQGSCDPFVMMFLLPNKQEVLQSVIKQRTLNPVFQQVFEFGGLLANELKNQVLVFRVFDHDRFSKNDLIGTVILPLKDADLYGMMMRRDVDQRKGLLKQFSAGDLLFSLKYTPDSHLLNGIILKATNLRKADIWGLADPYVKVYIIYNNKRVFKWKTVVKKNTLVPIYNEPFQFDLSGMDARQVSLEIWIMDYDWFSRNDKMGVVYVGANSPQEVGRCHWLEILSSPEQQTSHWHTIIPYTDLKQVLPLTKTQKPLHQHDSLLTVTEEAGDSLSSRPHTPTL